MGNNENPISYWQSLAIAADQGNLFLDSQAAAACSKACDDYIANLIIRRDDAMAMASVGGWGDFESGKAVQKLYSQRAFGGKNSMVDVLEGHIAVVTDMQIVFRKFFVDTGATDDGNATDLGQQGPK